VEWNEAVHRVAGPLQLVLTYDAMQAATSIICPLFCPNLAVIAIALLLVGTIALYLFVENFAPR